MYPQHELIQLAACKAALRRRIGVRRKLLADDLSRVVAPFAWIDRALGVWHRLVPLVRLAAVPLGILAARTFIPRMKFLGPLLRWGPLVLGAMRGIRAVGQGRGRPAQTSRQTAGS